MRQITNRITDGAESQLLDEALALVVRIHSGERAAPSPRNLDAWAAQSPGHAAAAAEASALWSDTGALRPMQGQSGRGPSRRVFMIGGAGALAAGSGWAWRNLRVPGEIATGTAETRTLALADGSLAELNARSGLDLGKDLPRRAELRAGQVWLDIRPDSRPFTLAAGRIAVEVDQGMVDLDRRAGDGGVTLALGAFPARLAGGGPVLEADSIYRLHAGQAPERLPRRAADAFAWRTGKLVAEEIPLSEIITILSDWYPGWIRVAGDGVAALPVTAVLDLRRPEAALRALEQGLPIRIRNIGGVVLSLGWA